MLKRKYSLKGKSSFKYILNKGETYASTSFILKYLNRDSEENRYFGIIASNKLHKRAYLKNKVKRIFSKAIVENLEAFPRGLYIFIPKKKIIDLNGRINTNVETISAEINTFLSKMAIS